MKFRASNAQIAHLLLTRSRQPTLIPCTSPPSHIVDVEYCSPFRRPPRAAAIFAKLVPPRRRRVFCKWDLFGIYFSRLINPRDLFHHHPGKKNGNVSLDCSPCRQAHQEKKMETRVWAACQVDMRLRRERRKRVCVCVCGLFVASTRGPGKKIGKALQKDWNVRARFSSC